MDGCRNKRIKCCQILREKKSFLLSLQSKTWITEDEEKKSKALHMLWIVARATTTTSTHTAIVHQSSIVMSNESHCEFSMRITMLQTDSSTDGLRELDMFDVQHFDVNYRAEGDANIVLALPQRHQVLRLPKSKRLFIILTTLAKFSIDSIHIIHHLCIKFTSISRFGFRFFVSRSRVCQCLSDDLILASSLPR